MRTEKAPSTPSIGDFPPFFGGILPFFGIKIIFFQSKIFCIIWASFGDVLRVCEARANDREAANIARAVS